MTLEELGVVLRAEREKRGLDIEDAASKLKISARLLRALEDGDEQSLPPLAYTKGFIRSYAAYVGLSAEEVGEALAALEAATETVTPQKNVYEPELMLTPRRNLKPIMTLIVAAVIVGGIIMAWQQGVFDFLGRQSRRLAQPAPMQSAESVDPGNLANRPPVTAPAASAPTAAPQAADQPGNAPGVQSAAKPGVAANAQPAQPSAAPSAQNGAPGLPPVRLPAQAAPAPAASALPASSAPAASAAGEDQQSSPHKVIITATDECWVHSSADKTDTRQFSLHKGDTFALTFNKSLELKLGNAGGVRLRYNGQDLPPVGQNGQVRTLVFPPAERP